MQALVPLQSCIRMPSPPKKQPPTFVPCAEDSYQPNKILDPSPGKPRPDAGPTIAPTYLVFDDPTKVYAAQ